MSLPYFMELVDKRRQNEGNRIFLKRRWKERHMGICLSKWNICAVLTFSSWLQLLACSRNGEKGTIVHKQRERTWSHPMFALEELCPERFDYSTRFFLVEANVQFTPSISLDSQFIFYTLWPCVSSALSHAVRDCFELITCLKLAWTPAPHACWDYRHTSPCLA